MKARAIAPGFYRGARIREGQVFDLEEGAKGTWFREIGREPEDKAQAKPGAAAAAEAKAKADAEAKAKAQEPAKNSRGQAKPGAADADLV